MPVIPFAAAAGALFGTSAAVGGTIIAGTALAGGLALSQKLAADKQAKALRSSMGANTGQPNASQTVGSPLNANNANLGRAALISTSPSGVLGTDPTGRRKLLGND